MSKIPNSFEMSKLRLLKNGGIEVSFSNINVEKDETNTVYTTIKDTRDPHPDLEKLIEGLKESLARTYNLLSFKSLDKIAETHKKSEALKSVKELFKGLEDQILKDIEITGITLSGEENNRGINIQGVSRYNNEALAINSPRIRVDGSKWGFEVKLSETIEDIIEEVKAYLFEGKAKQLDMFAGEKESEEVANKEESVEKKEEVAA